VHYLFCDVDSDKLFEDIVRHESHDISWCYWFERDVSQYKKITRNHKTNKISYTSYYLRCCLTITHINIQKVQDGLLSNTSVLLVVHKCLTTQLFKLRTRGEQKNL
jgi:hypothetical protein